MTMIPTFDHVYPTEADESLACGITDVLSGAVCNRPLHQDARHADASDPSIHISWTEWASVLIVP